MGDNIFRGLYQSKACMRLPISDYSNTNWHHISYHFWVIAAYCSNFGHCVLSHPLGGLGTTYDVYIWLIGKRVVDFLLVLLVFSFLNFFARCCHSGATGENRLKIGDFAKTRSVWPCIIASYCGESRLCTCVSVCVLECWPGTRWSFSKCKKFISSCHVHQYPSVSFTQPPTCHP